MAHKRVFDILVLAGLGIALAGSSGMGALASEAPVAVSPGSASKVALIGDGCPTFSWGAAEGASSYELVVYRLAEEGEEAQPVLSETLAGSASSWTPSLDRCLERGGRYAWSVRAVGGKEASEEWSALSLFQVAARPNEAELEEAVRQYFVTEGGAELKGTAEAEAQSNREASPSSPGAPAAGVVGTTQLSVDGGIEATSFTGDGSTLTDLTAANVSGTLADAQVANDITLDDITQITARGIASTTGFLDPDRLAGDTTDDDKVDSGLLGVHEHDDRYFTETETSAVGTVNTPANPVDWTKLKGVPAGFADGSDNDTDTTCDGAACDGTSFTSLQWANLTGLPTTTKGDLLVEDGADVVALPVGTDGQVLMADSGQSAGMTWATVADSCPVCSSPALVHKTGQTTSYDNRDDGELERGVVWPNPRFTDNTDGTVTDNLTGLIWLEDASCSDLAGTDASGQAVWATALSAANLLASGTCGLTDGSVAEAWRLPNRLELESLLDFEFFGPALANAAGTAKWTEGDVFSGVVSSNYWSSTTFALSTTNAWSVNLNNGFVLNSNKTTNAYVWPVRGGQ